MNQCQEKADDESAQAEMQLPWAGCMWDDAGCPATDQRP